MKCPFCDHADNKVVDSRESSAGDAIRRRRECLSCGRRFTSYERIEEIPYLVIKKDGRRVAFDRQKLMAGLHRACEKRPVSAKALAQIADDVEQLAQEESNPDAESQEQEGCVIYGMFFDGAKWDYDINSLVDQEYMVMFCSAPLVLFLLWLF